LRARQLLCCKVKTALASDNNKRSQVAKSDIEMFHEAPFLLFL